jgi:uncharacterized membrane protein YfcA
MERAGERWQMRVATMDHYRREIRIRTIWEMVAWAVVGATFSAFLFFVMERRWFSALVCLVPCWLWLSFAIAVDRVRSRVMRERDAVLAYWFTER